MERYWVYINSKVQGPVEVPALRKVPGFTLLTQVCAEGDQTWRMADEVIDIKSYFLAPPRASALMMEAGNTVVVQEPAPAEVPVLSVVEADPLPEKPQPIKVEVPAGQNGPATLRLTCSVCAYKNPRDVTVCMKCGTAIKNGPSAAAPPELETLPPGAAVKQVSDSAIPAPIPVEKPSTSIPDSTYAVSDVSPKANAMIEIPVTRILALVAGASLLGGFGFAGYKLWKKNVHPKTTLMAPRPDSSPQASSTGSPIPSKAPAKIPGVTQQRRVGPRKVRHVPTVAPAALPGVTAAKRRGENQVTSVKAPSYRVVPEATPLRHRVPAPVTSSYAVKRRANQGLWEGQEEQAVKQVQHYRIYGGQRTIQRNVDILMQILRDREYNTAFESGKRLYFYNDMDWDAGPTDGPAYEVRLTFSGGREQDGSARKPLRFAFQTDLERGTVEPGGNEQVQANTMHAFFDESRIPPEDRRAIAKDTEELVLAAQPDASPLAMDTVVRHFAATYSSEALSRVASAYGLTLVERKMAHEPKVASEAMPWDKTTSVAPAPTPTPSAVANASPTTKITKSTLPSRGGAVDYRMENGTGRERTLLAQVSSQASASRLWETLTSYDRLKQFVPDVLVSEREGQDGSAIIVHTVSLTRLLFFVFKVNLHLRIIEHPQQHSLDFERIAGEFEQFRGSIELPSQAGSTSLVFHATVVPKGHMPDWVLRDMTRHFLVPVLEALRAHAESN